MKAQYMTAIRYLVRAKCQTPLRTAGADADTESVLRSRDGHAMIQGSSLAGAMREWITANENETMAEAMFGSQKEAGSLILSDAVFSADAKSSVRPRLRIDGKSGSASDGGKFDVMHIETGSECDFTITWLGKEENAKETECIERMLCAMNAGQIRFGAQKTNGFGRVALTVRKRAFDLRKAEDRNAWLADKDDAVPLALKDIPAGKSVVFTLKGTADSLLVKSEAIETDGGKKSWTPNLTEAGKPVLPGSSVKGAVRARAEIISDVLGLDGAVLKDVFGSSPEEEEKLAGKVCFDDVVLAKANRQKISRIRINKFTGGVMRGGLFTEEPVSSEVNIVASVPADCPEGCMLVLYALRDLGMGLYNLGSGWAIGRGFVSGETLEAQLPKGKHVMLRFNRDGTVKLEDPDGTVATWRKSLEEVRV